MPRLLVVLILALSAGQALAGPTVLQRDLDGDGRRERVVLDGRHDPALSVWQGSRRMWQGLPRRWHPWKLALADVDGDGRPEIVVGVTKGTRYRPKPHHCLFVYGWDGRRVFPRWLGSSLSKPFTDFAFAGGDDEGGERLFAVEITRDGRRCLVCYAWSGFGFEGRWQRGSWKSARFVTQGGRPALEADGRVQPLPTGREPANPAAAGFPAAER